MNMSVLTADPATHVKIVAVALLGAILVVLISVFASQSAINAPGPRIVVKVSSATTHASTGFTVLR